MLLTNQQKCIMEILEKVGCIRRDQLLTLLRGKYREQTKAMRPEHLAPMLQQLVAVSRTVYVEGNIICFSAQKIDPLRLEAIDVMLEITGGYPLQFSRPSAVPSLLCFLYGDDLTVYYVVSLKADTMPLIRHTRVDEAERLIWIAGQPQIQPEGELPDRQIFALLQKDGTHRFFANKQTTF